MNDKQSKQMQTAIVQAFDSISMAAKEFKAKDLLTMDLCLESAINSLQHARNLLQEVGKK